MTIFGWSCREPVEHSSPGGHCSSKWHPSKLFRASQCGGFDGRFALSSPVSSSTEINKKAPTDARRVRRGVRGAGRGCAGMSVTWDKAQLTTAEGTGFISPARCLHWGVCLGAGLLRWQRCLPLPEVPQSL